MRKGNEGLTTLPDFIQIKIHIVGRFKGDHSMTTGSFSIVSVAFAFGLLLGSVLLLASVYSFVKHRQFGLSGTVLVVFGSMLLGLSVWTSFEFSVDSEGKVTARYDQDLGAKAADLNGKVEQLRFKVDELAQDISDLKRATPSAKISPEVTSEREARRRAFEQNAAYSVLVFHKSEQQETASALADALLSAGFKSSATPTQLKEAVKQLNPNEAWVIYSSRGKEKLSDVKRILMAVAPNVHYIDEPQPSNLRRGDIQVLLF